MVSDHNSAIDACCVIALNDNASIALNAKASETNPIDRMSPLPLNRTVPPMSGLHDANASQKSEYLNSESTAGPPTHKASALPMRPLGVLRLTRIRSLTRIRCLTNIRSLTRIQYHSPKKAQIINPLNITIHGP